MTTDGEEGSLETYARTRIGTVLRGKYRLDALVGVGGMAVVYRATHRNQAEFAVKMLHPELSIREDVRTRFLREGYAANSVKHPGVVLVVDDDVTEEGGAFLVMEMLDGVGCDAAWEKCGGRMPVDQACVIVHQLLDVLAAAHAKGIIHRDIKPANLFITREGRLKVLDFGIARVRDVAATNVTMTGMLLGTPAFMGPEQALAKSTEIDARTDVWAVGATLFTLISGVLVHEGENAQQLMVKAATQKARSLAEVAPEVPAAVVAVVDRALAFAKADRWPSAAAMRDALGTAFQSAFGRAPSPSHLVALVERAGAGGEASRESALAPTESDPGVAASAPAGAAKAMPPTLPMTVATSPALTEIAEPSGARLPDMKAVGMSTASPVVASDLRAPTASTPRRRSPLPIYAGIGALAVLVVGGGIWASTHGGTSSDGAGIAASPGNAPSVSALTTAATAPPAVSGASGASGADSARGPSPGVGPASTTRAPAATAVSPAGALPGHSATKVATAPVTAVAPPDPAPALPTLVVATPPPPPTPATDLPPARPTDPPPARFTPNGDAIADAQTGRSWQARPFGPVSFDAAQARCNGAGFRLPSEGELRALAAADASMFGDLSSFFWTSTRRQAGSTRVSIVQPRGGSKEVFANDPDVKTMTRCVR